MKRLKSMLKNNKGVTLVELIISSAILLLIITAFLSMIASATKMFARGSRDLDVQEEAQSVTTQIENLLADANLYAGQVGNEIYIVNEDLVHVITETSNGVYYSNYEFPATQDPTTENVKTLLAANNTAALKGPVHLSSALLSKRMNHLALNTDNLDSDNIVYLSMSYKNQDREVAVNESVYLRNEPGTGGGHGHNVPPDNDFDAELFVLRYKNHNLKTDFGVNKVTSISGADASKYDLDINTGVVKLKSSVAIGESSAGGATVTCTKNNQPYKIRLSFDACSIGLQDSNNLAQTVSLRAANVEQANDYIAVKGFDTHSTDVFYTVTLKIAPSYNFTSGNALTASRFTSSATTKQLGEQSILEGDKQFAGGGYYKGVYRLLLDNQSNHLIFRQLSQCDRVETRTNNKPVPMYTIKVEHKSGTTYETLGETTIKVNIPNSSWYH